MTLTIAAPVQAWLDAHRAGAKPPVNDLCSLCEERVRELVQPRLRTFPLVVQDSQTTEVANEALLRLLAALGRDVRPQSTLDLERFLAHIIRRVLLDMNRAIQKRRSQVGALGDAPVAAPEDEDRIETDLMVAFHEYIEALQPDEQALFDVFYYQGKTKLEAAALLGLPPTTVHAHWVKARYRASKKFGRDLTD
ncbi:sigma-70 family rna polymerase sigma factor : RNA polymerase sigma factor, sigma-70 family OS=Singulisphaera acidiphila (strain ATCC BAA-1392 / DSM 18658 / VKM B-2454 / MOB10) GN=Sinac_5005 PE=4 SV=1: Sigma70_ECF [Gemmata massiliana]|uniref:RNA polymerase sigma-70 ECF-like HTH domain-containing protein n=1 Tax=Gemmata massiliana TaxID=1210884 RepID=A0A6P2DHS6_9BACT|nr:sigma-70 family RNA polymerase sigma factor [Gemmata massiliana]VTR99484.1 sigma-70 family rna polymerase sigma factor : RNA polymerase sigma factor, sigma-70 family OS=Singulisphaera acidiphila (strain ATCC BAA-1392 / DSM 18658 / VKM B-2454 / MOB10) GN=Sinac_5005 PE=4 SV=1: Sigma70_ECF [Gemmata massiliana]